MLVNQAAPGFPTLADLRPTFRDTGKVDVVKSAGVAVYHPVSGELLGFGDVVDIQKSGFLRSMDSYDRIADVEAETEAERRALNSVFDDHSLFSGAVVEVQKSAEEEEPDLDDPDRFSPNYCMDSLFPDRLGC